MTMETDDNVRLSRRDLLGASVIGAIAATSSLRAQGRADHAGDVLETRGHPIGQRLPTNAQSGGRFRPRFRVGIGLSERRLGRFLHNHPRDDHVLSSKIGRLFHATTKALPVDPFFKNPAPFSFTFDYSAAGARRSVEDSLNRLGVERLDLVFIHDISPDNTDLPRPWRSMFGEAAPRCGTSCGTSD